MRIKAKRSYSIVKSGNEQKNFCEIRYRYKDEKASDFTAWATILAKNSTSDEIITDALNVAMDLRKSYVVQVGVVDDVGESAQTTIYVPTDSVYLHKAGSINSIGVGKYVSDPNTVDVAEEITTRFRGEVLIGDEATPLKDYILAVISEGG